MKKAVIRDAVIALTIGIALCFPVDLGSTGKTIIGAVAVGLAAMYFLVATNPAYTKKNRTSP